MIWNILASSINYEIHNKIGQGAEKDVIFNVFILTGLCVFSSPNEQGISFHPNMYIMKENKLHNLLKHVVKLNGLRIKHKQEYVIIGFEFECIF